MNSWCESCAKKSQCYTAEIRPKCYVATTNTDTHDEAIKAIAMLIKSRAEPFFRNPTEEEMRSVHEYIESISTPT